MEKKTPLSKIYEALSAVADQRIDIQTDRAYVLSSDHAKRYTVKFLENGYSSNDNATLWQHYPGYPILAVMMIQGQLKIHEERLSWFREVNWKQLNTKYKNQYDKAIAEFLEPFSEVVRSQIEDEVECLFHQLESMELTIKGNREPRNPQ